MTWKSFQHEAFQLTAKEIDKLTPYIIAQYQEALKSINKELKKVYLEILSGVDPDDYYNTMLKYDRLTKLHETIARQYTDFSKKAGKMIGNAGEIAMSNNYYRMQYTHLWLVPGTDFAILPASILQMSVYGSTEAWKKYTASIMEKIYGSGQLYYPQAGTLSEFLAANRLKELENIQRAVTQGLLQGHGYRKTAKSIQGVIGQYLVKDGTVYTSGAMANSTRIVRTETIRIMNEAATANSEYAKSQGVDIVRIWDATLDQRTRPTHAALDGKAEDKNGLWHMTVAKAGRISASGPGQWPVVGQNVHCRCSTFESVNGSKPTLRRGINIKKYEQEFAKAKAEGLSIKQAEKKAAANSKEAFSYKIFDEWAKENGLVKNKFGKYYHTKK